MAKRRSSYSRPIQPTDPSSGEPEAFMPTSTEAFRHEPTQEPFLHPAPATPLNADPQPSEILVEVAPHDTVESFRIDTEPVITPPDDTVPAWEADYLREKAQDVDDVDEEWTTDAYGNPVKVVPAPTTDAYGHPLKKEV